jgi:leucyl-tRNA synthetase
MFETLSTDEPTAEELRSLHKLIKKITWDIDNFSFNTSIPAFMIAQNEFQALKCNKVEILKTFAVLLAPYAPHIAEEAYSLCLQAEGKEWSTVNDAQWPVCNEAYLVEATQKYPVQFNGKVRFTIEVAKDTPREEVEKIVMAHELTVKQLNGNAPKKVIVVPGRIVNIVM